VTEYLTAKQVGVQLDVSRETLERLEIYVELLLKWQCAINLIGPRTVADVWGRHVLDCGQLMRYIPKDRSPVVDIGSGAGLPGLILAIMGVPDVKLVESDSRKCTFLREAARITKTPVEIVESRIEHLKNIAAGVVTARALAPLTMLTELSQSVTKRNTIYLFLKGKDLKNELTDLKKNWKMNWEVHPSVTNPDGSILKMESVARVITAHD
jgi:16S rRNA (guanine527-N7)-methyltransferase